MIEKIIVLFMIFAAPLPWWLILLHTVLRKKSKFGGWLIYFSIGAVWLALGYLSFILNLPKFFFENRFSMSTPLLILGVLAIAAAILIDWQVMKTLGWKRLICLTEVRKQADKEQLVTSGIYNYARHPRYIEYPLWSLGIGLIFGYPLLLWFALYLFLSFWLVSYFEEAELIERFGEVYKEYQKRTPRFFIRLWPRKE